MLLTPLFILAKSDINALQTMLILPVCILPVLVSILVLFNEFSEMTCKVVVRNIAKYFSLYSLVSTIIFVIL